MSFNPKALEQYLKTRLADIEADAQVYAKSFNVSIEKARYDVHGEYVAAYVCEVEQCS